MNAKYSVLLLVVAVVLLVLLRYVDYTIPQPLSSAQTWNGITPGQTTADKVVQLLGQPTWTDCEDPLAGLQDYDKQDRDPPGCIPGQEVYFYAANEREQDMGSAAPTIYFKEGQVRAHYRLMRREERIQFHLETLNDLKQQYGRPDRVGWSRFHIGAYGDRIVVFPNRGILADLTDSFVIYLMYFVPMSRESFEQEWGFLLNSRGPVWLVRGDMGYGPLDPWGINNPFGLPVDSWFGEWQIKSQRSP